MPAVWMAESHEGQLRHGTRLTFGEGDDPRDQLADTWPMRAEEETRQEIRSLSDGQVRCFRTWDPAKRRWSSWTVVGPEGVAAAERSARRAREARS